MRKLLSVLCITFLPFLLSAQSVLISPGAQSINGESTNQEQLSVFGNGLLVAPKVNFSEDDPASNVHIMDFSSETESGALAGRLKDPSGDVNYTAGLGYDCSFVIYTSDPLFLACQIDFEVLDTEADGDTVYITDFFTDEILGAYSGSSIPASLIVSSYKVRVKFKTDGDANVGAGFVLKWRAILKGSLGSLQNYAGEGLVYDANSKALWSGGHSLSSFNNKGVYSTALGRGTVAHGKYSTALGYYSEAGYYSTATGYVAKANGTYCTSMGYRTEATAEFSTAMGAYAKALGFYSTAIGMKTTASGDYSTAMGTQATTNGYQGSMVLADYALSPGDSLVADISNRLLARFENGYTFYTDNDLSSATKYGIMAHNRANSWSSISDSTKKENFIASNGEKVLKSVSQMRIGTWNYKGDDTSKNRHWGVMAQDFYHHFGKDAYGTIGNDTTIATADFDGVSFAAIKALEARTKKLQSDLAREKRFSASLELTSRKQEETIEKLRTATEGQKQTIEELQEQLQKQLQRNTAYESELLSVRAESRTVQAESKALKEDFKELKEMLLKSVAVKTTMEE